LSGETFIAAPKMKKMLFIERKIVMLRKKAFVESETIALWER
jgi:hypothetical protein